MNNDIKILLADFLEKIALVISEHENKLSSLNLRLLALEEEKNKFKKHLLGKKWRNLTI